MSNVDQLKSLIQPVLDEMNIELVDIEFGGGSKKRLLRVLVHEDGGIKLDRCVKASRALSDLLDRKDTIDKAYTLEVSSAGLTRPLKIARDFERNIGQKIHAIVKYEDRSKDYTGKIQAVTENKVELLDDKEEQTISFEINDVMSAKIVIEF